MSFISSWFCSYSRKGLFLLSRTKQAESCGRICDTPTEAVTSGHRLAGSPASVPPPSPLLLLLPLPEFRRGSMAERRLVGNAQVQPTTLLPAHFPFCSACLFIARKQEAKQWEQLAPSQAKGLALGMPSPVPGSLGLSQVLWSFLLLCNTFHSPFLMAQTTQQVCPLLPLL